MRLWKALYAVFIVLWYVYMARGQKTAYRQNENLFGFKNAVFVGKMAYIIPKKLDLAGLYKSFVENDKRIRISIKKYR